MSKTDRGPSIDIVRPRLADYLSNHRVVVNYVRLVGALCDALAVTCHEEATLVLLALEKMEADGEVVLTRWESKIVKVEYGPSHFTGDPEPPAPIALQFSPFDKSYITLTKAWLVLLTAVGPTGTAEGVNLKQVLVHEMGLPSNRYSTVVGLLRELEIYNTENLGHGKYRLTVRSGPVVVTAAMVDEAYARINARQQCTVDPNHEITMQLACKDARIAFLEAENERLRQRQAETDEHLMEVAAMLRTYSQVLVGRP